MIPRWTCATEEDGEGGSGLIDPGCSELIEMVSAPAEAKYAKLDLCD